MGDGALIVVDTHAVVWSMSDSPRLSAKARAVIQQARAETTLHIASITLLELARLIAEKHLDLNATVDAFLIDIEANFTVLPITAAIAAATTRLPESYPRDPADRIIGATALVHGAPLVTADQRIRKAKALRTIW